MYALSGKHKDFGLGNLNVQTTLEDSNENHENLISDVDLHFFNRDTYDYLPNPI